MRSSFKALPPAFFLPAPTIVAPALIGKLIVRQTPQGTRCARIVETEAYLGRSDPAAHASHGLTRRTAILYGPPGRAYIYLSYGIHLCLNVSTCPDGEAGGVLFRAAAEVACHPELGRSRWSLGGGLRWTAGEARSARGLPKLAPMDGNSDPHALR